MMHNLCMSLSIGQVFGIVVEDDSDVSYFADPSRFIYMVSSARASAALMAVLCFVSYIVHRTVSHFFESVFEEVMKVLSLPLHDVGLTQWGMRIAIGTVSKSLCWESMGAFWKMQQFYVLYNRFVYKNPLEHKLEVKKSEQRAINHDFLTSNSFKLY